MPRLSKNSHYYSRKVREFIRKAVYSVCVASDKPANYYLRPIKPSDIFIIHHIIVVGISGILY